jgi:hypothetical protein
MLNEKTIPAANSEPMDEQANSSKASWKEVILGGNNPADKSMNWVFACFGFWIALAPIIYVIGEFVPYSFLNQPFGISLIRAGCLLIGLTGVAMQTFATILAFRAPSGSNLSWPKTYAMMLCFLGWFINGIIGVAFVMAGLLPPIK